MSAGKGSYLSHHVADALKVPRLFCQGLGGEFFCVGEEPTEKGHVEEILDSAQIEAPAPSIRGWAD